MEKRAKVISIVNQKGGRVMEKLKKCPFCDGEAEIIGVYQMWIRCCNCGAETDVYDSKEELIEAWNGRVKE